MTFGCRTQAASHRTFIGRGATPLSFQALVSKVRMRASRTAARRHYPSPPKARAGPQAMDEQRSLVTTCDMRRRRPDWIELLLVIALIASTGLMAVLTLLQILD